MFLIILGGGVVAILAVGGLFMDFLMNQSDNDEEHSCEKYLP